MKVIKYIVTTDPETDEIDGLLRIVQDEGVGLWGEEYINGKWHESTAAMSYMHEPGLEDFVYDEKEANRIMQLLDGKK